MTLTNEDLLAIRGMIVEAVKGELAPIRTDIDFIKHDIQTLKKDVRDLKFDVAALRHEITATNIKVESLQAWRDEMLIGAH